MTDDRPDDPREELKRNATKEEKVRAFLAVAMRRFKTSADFESTLRAEMLVDKQFRASEQWPADIKRDREIDKRPCLTINRFPQVLGQISDQQRQSRPRIQINPVDGGSDVDTAEAIQGVIRNIETQSDVETVYETGCNDQRVMGRGYWRILTEYASEDGFDQELRLKRVRNAFTVYRDPACLEATYSDARFYFIDEDVPRDEYRVRYPKSALASLNNFQSPGDTPVDWVNEKAVRIAEYWYVEEKTEKLSLIEIPASVGLNGEEMPASRQIVPLGEHQIEGAKVLQTREVRRRAVKWATINAIEILEGNDDLTEGRDWPGKAIPIIPVLGDEIDINGKVDYRGVVRDARDMQRLYNYQVSALVEAVALAPKAPYIGAEGQFADHEHEWETANIKNWSRLEYKPVSLAGQLAPPPQRQTYEPAIQAIVVSVRQADNDIKGTTGYNDASLGQQGPQESGTAIMARQRQDEKGSSSYVSNFARAVRYTGELLVDLIPRVYDAPRVMRILGTDDQPKLVMLHAGQPPAGNVEDLQREKGIAGIYDVSAGRYDVTVSVGPSYESRRQESVSMLMTAVEKMPPLFQMVGDLLFKNMDVPGSQEIAKRLQKMLPPQLQEGKPGEPEIPPQVQQQMQQAQEQIKQMGQQLQQAQMMIETEAQKLAAQGQQKQMELQSKERVEMAKLQADQQIAQLQAQADLLKIQAQQQADERIAKLEAALQEMAARMDFQREAQAARQSTALDIAKTHATQPMVVAEVEPETNGNRAERPQE